jgi:ubiquinone/menaquinone biosynthesis C-methylase UbiE
MNIKTRNQLVKNLCIEARDKGWQRAVVEKYGNLEKAPWIADFSRADSLLFANLNPSSNVLDLGSGYGVLSFALSPLCKSVVSLDSREEYAEFVTIRAQQDDTSNITSVLADFTTLPFRESTFDLIILNKGIPAFTLKKDLNSLLRQIYILLKPKGEIHIAVDRWAFKYTSFLSCKRLEKQLCSVGFTVDKIIIPLKRYYNFKFLLEYKNMSIISFFFEFLIKDYTYSIFEEKLFTILFKMAKLTKLDKVLFTFYLSRSYLIFARKT